LSTWTRLEHYIRTELQLPSHGRLVLTVQHEALGPRPHDVSSATSLYVLHQKLDAHADEVAAVAIGGDMWRWVAMGGDVW